MPRPNKGETQKDFVARFMGSEEAQADFPDQNQRLAVAYSMWGRRDNASGEHPWPKEYICDFIEPGVVFYQDLGPCKVCGDKVSCGEGACQPEGETVLVKQDALAKMAKSFIGKAVVDVVHKDVGPEFIASGEADGIVTDVWFDDKSGWWKAKYLVWNPETQRHCESLAYSVSCAYEPTEVEGGGVYHNLPYQEEVKNGRYTHLAVVTNPRYEGARIYVNSKGGSMNWKFWQKGERKNAAPLDPETVVNVDGADVPLKDLLKASAEAEAAAKNAAKPELTDETVLEHEGKETTIGELKKNWRNRKNADAPKPEAPKPAEPEAPKPAPVDAPKPAEPKNASDMSRDELLQAYNDLLEKGKKPANDAPGEKEPLPDLRSAADAKAAEEKKNAEEAAKKAEEEKKNAEAAKKAEEEKKNAEALEEKRNAGRRAFADLRNAAGQRFGEAVGSSVVSMDDRLKRGREKYGSPA